MNTAFRQLEPWMKKGATVTASNTTGTIKNMLTTTLGESTGIRSNGPVVISFLVETAGTKTQFTVPAHNVNPVAPRCIPFPEHIG